MTAALQAVAEIDHDGEPKYPPREMRELVRVVVCRTYASAVLELAHLVTAVEALGRGRDRYERFFWTPGPARAAWYRGYLRQMAAKGGWARPGFALTDSGVDIAYPDGRFTVTYRRMPFLAALMEFLASTIGYGRLDDALRRTPGAGASMAAVSDSANAISRAIYDYFREHLPSAQNQRKFRRMVAFLAPRFGARFGGHDIDDEAILDFWLAESTSGEEDGVDFKTYHTVFWSFVRLIQAIEQAICISGVEGARRLGKDREGGEIDPDLIGEAAEALDEPSNPLSELQDGAPAQVKFLNKQEQAALDALFAAGPVAQRLALSVMRAEVFGKAQGRVTQGLRRRLGRAELDALIDASAEEDYPARRERLAALLAHVERALLASLHALLKGGSREAVSLLLDLRPGLDLSAVAERLAPVASGNVVPLRGPSVAQRFLDMLEDPAQVGPELAGLLAEARKAHRNLARQGFERDPADAEIVAAFEAGGPLLLRVRATLEQFLRRLEGAPPPAGDWAGQFAADADTYYRQFRVLYGGQP